MFVFIKLYPVVLFMAVGELLSCTMYARRCRLQLWSSVILVMLQNLKNDLCRNKWTFLGSNYGTASYFHEMRSLVNHAYSREMWTKQAKYETDSFCSSNSLITGRVTPALLSPQTQKLHQNILLKCQFSFLQSFSGPPKEKVWYEVTPFVVLISMDNISCS